MNRIATDPGRLAARAGTRLLLVVAGLLLASRPVVAQEMGPPRPPLIPLLEPRPAELPGPGNQLQTVRPGEEKQPIASFLKSLQGADATIEVIVGQARLLTTKQPIATERGAAVVAVGDPSVVDFEVLPNPRMIRLIGKRPGVTDLSIITADEQTYQFEVQVVYDVALLNAQLRQAFPDNEIRVSQLRGAVVLEGQVRSLAQANAIEAALRGHLLSLAGAAGTTVRGGAMPVAAPAPGQAPPPVLPGGAAPAPAPADVPPPPGRDEYFAEVEPGQRTATITVATPPQVINLMRVPGLHQVLLEVKIGELNRTALREMGADWLFGQNDTVIGTTIAGSAQNVLTDPDTGSQFFRLLDVGANSTAFGVFPSGNFKVLLRALRDNSVLNVLAEPNLVAMSGQQASFLAGGQFPVPVPQGGGGLVNNITIQFKNFGVQLAFVPYVLDDETIRLQVAPEVSSIDFSLGTTLVQGGDPIPGLSTRRVETTVELKQGSTLALAGLLQVDLDARTQRIPGIGDLPYLGPFFSNTSHHRVEKELLIMVTPHLIQPMKPDQVPPLPGSEIEDPNDCEFYFLNRIEGRTGQNYRSPLGWDNVWHCVEKLKLEERYIQGPVGYSK